MAVHICGAGDSNCVWRRMWTPGHAAQWQTDSRKAALCPMKSIAQLADAMAAQEDLLATHCHCHGPCFAECKNCANFVLPRDDTPPAPEAPEAAQQDDDSMVGYASEDAPARVRPAASAAHGNDKRKGAARRAGKEKLTHRSDSKQPSTKHRPHFPQQRLAGSTPTLVNVDDDRKRKMEELARVEGFGQDSAGKGACMAEFTFLLLASRFSEGSWKHEEGCDTMCERTCRGSCRKDGNVYKYPSYQGTQPQCLPK